MIGAISANISYLIFDLSFAVVLWNWSEDCGRIFNRVAFKFISIIAYLGALLQIVVIYKIINP